MGSINKITKQKMASYFRNVLGAINYRKGWMKSKCPFCGREDKYGINLSHNRTNCFRCGAHPSPISLIMDLEKLDNYSEFISFINHNIQSSYQYIEEDYILPESVTLEMPKGFKIFGSENNTSFSKIANNYIQSRGFDINMLRRLGWGYCTSGPLFGYMIIPFFKDGQMVYYNARKIIGNGPRYKNPDTDNSGVGKSFLIYNQEALQLYDKIYLCEGAINAVTLGERAISTGGKSISRYQLNNIIKSSVDKVVIILDPDAYIKALELALKLVESKKVKVIKLPNGKDINDLGRKSTLSLVRVSPYLNYNEISKMLQQTRLNESIKIK